jgi:hypothetical protein
MNFGQPTIIAEMDDYPVEGSRSIEKLDEYKKKFPNFKLTIFAIPSLMTKELWTPLLDRKDWIHIGIHGFKHKKGECRRLRIGRDEYRSKLQKVVNSNPNWGNIIKPPFYGAGKNYILAALDLGLDFSLRDVYKFYSKFTKEDDISSYNSSKVFFKNDDRFNKVILFGHTCKKQSIHRVGVKKWWRQSMEKIDNFVYTEDVSESVFYKLNIGCGDQIVDGFENLDPRTELDPRIKKWEWGTPLPYLNDSVSVAGIQHVLMYCDKALYHPNLLEIRRVLSPAGRFIVKEDNNLKHIWRKEGTKHNTGTIRSNTNRQELEQILNKAGFEVVERDHHKVIEKYGSFINRQHKLDRDICFVFECKKVS